MMNLTTSSPSFKISGIEITGETLTSRGGPFFLGRYLENMGFLRAVANEFSDLRKNRKGVAWRP